MIKKLTVLVFASAFVFGLCGIAAAQTCADIHGSPAGCAPSPLDGTPVTLTGVVYVPAGTYNSGSVYIQCGSAGGMTFFNSSALVEEGDLIQIDGVVGAFSAEIQLASGATWSVIGSGIAEPTPIGSGALAAGGNFLGDFMRVEGILEFVSSGFNSVYTVDDGTGPAIVFVDGSTGIDTSIYDASLGDYVSIIGSTKCFDGVGEILPRRNEDFQLVSIPELPDSWGALKVRY